ncbi:peroxiredoxin [Arcicella aurantiaca]|uniref:thioredoxin-dependent peroxiredoxin n=1 Tax=Arcicella aurantiaca TaxID=591202 RepID=A0A316E967_9BACT|nr:peroxiredoxin-like family protein [Arcicella aurantiaca]PWK19430.1 peroxiredoxin [Arcicella aurantiaca]
MENTKKITRKSQTLRKTLFAILGGIGLLFGYLFIDANANVPTKLEVNQSIPDFTTTDVTGKTVSSTTLKGKKTVVIFERFVGCPVCNAHVHQLMQEYKNLKEKGIELIVIYESSNENLMKYATTEEIPFTLIADPNGTLYDTFGVTKSMAKVMKGFIFKGGKAAASEGTKAYKGNYEMDGSKSRLTAEFLINTDGTIANAHYAQYLNDNLPIEVIKNF